MNLHAPIDPVAELAANVSVPFAQARAMPKSVYTSPEFLAAEMAHIFGKEWYCVGRASSLKEPGDYIAFELAGQPRLALKRTSFCLLANLLMEVAQGSKGIEVQIPTKDKGPADVLKAVKIFAKDLRRREKSGAHHAGLNPGIPLPLPALDHQIVLQHGKATDKGPGITIGS